MNTEELAEKLARTHDLPKARARELVDSIFEIIADQAVSGRDVVISGFGRFATKSVAPKVGRNPRTGAKMEIPASQKPAFTPAKRFKDKALDAHRGSGPRLVHTR
jgi:DNA-binding protein HU-beta